jgi:hypothetical protein
VVTGGQTASGRQDLPPGVFISYRRELDSGWAPWIYDQLAERFGASRIFMDLDSINAGDDFVEVITRSVASCRILIALIGKGWSAATDADGRRRLDDPADFVRLEIESALRHGIRVIPLLIENAQMPSATELPDSLAPIVSRQALTLTAAHRRYDAEHLIQAVNRVFDEALLEPEVPPGPPPGPAPANVLAALEPDVAHGLRGATMSIRLHNEGGAGRIVELQTAPLEAGVHVTPDRFRIQVPARATAREPLAVRAARPVWWGRTRTVRLRIHTADPAVSPASLVGRFRQHAILGWPALIALTVAIGLSIALLPRPAAGGVIVPPVATDEGSARSTLQQAGLAVAVTTTPSGTIPKGKVVRTGPGAGTRVPRGSVVTLYVSSGPATASPTPSATPTPTAQGACATVPPIVGRSERAARSAIRDAGLRYNISYRHNASVDVGNVISTKPRTGTPACNGVVVYVSTGPAPATCSLSPRTGSAGSMVRMSCVGFSPGETVTIRWGGNELTTTAARDDGSVSTSVAIPDGFAGSNYPGKVYTLQAGGQSSDRHASADFTVSDDTSPKPPPPPPEPPPPPPPTPPPGAIGPLHPRLNGDM